MGACAARAGDAAVASKVLPRGIRGGTSTQKGWIVAVTKAEMMPPTQGRGGLAAGLACQGAVVEAERRVSRHVVVAED